MGTLRRNEWCESSNRGGILNIQLTLTPDKPTFLSFFNLCHLNLIDFDLLHYHGAHLRQPQAKNQFILTALHATTTEVQKGLGT